MIAGYSFLLGWKSSCKRPCLGHTMLGFTVLLASGDTALMKRVMEKMWGMLSKLEEDD